MPVSAGTEKPATRLAKGLPAQPSEIVSRTTSGSMPRIGDCGGRAELHFICYPGTLDDQTEAVDTLQQRSGTG